jgi:hypothetical protein
MAKRVKHNFSRSSIGKNILISVGQTTHALTTRMTILSAGYKVRSIQALEKEAALKQGAELIGEGFIFSVAGALVVWEYDKRYGRYNNMFGLEGGFLPLLMNCFASKVKRKKRKRRTRKKKRN